MRKYCNLLLGIFWQFSVSFTLSYVALFICFRVSYFHNDIDVNLQRSDAEYQIGSK